MTVRKTTTNLFSTLPLASGFSLAATQTSFESQLKETADALRAENFGAVGREEKLEAEHNLQIARDLARQGQAPRPGRTSTSSSTPSPPGSSACPMMAAFPAKPNNHFRETETC